MPAGGSHTQDRGQWPLRSRPRQEDSYSQSRSSGILRKSTRFRKLCNNLLTLSGIDTGRFIVTPLSTLPL